MLENQPCPCGKLKSYQNCCGRFIEGNAFASTPEELMRSRYSAFVVENIDYLKATMRGTAAKNFNRTETWVKTVHWEGLTVMKQYQKSPCLGFVSFEARYTIDNILYTIREKSKFNKVNGQWFYVSGIKL